MAVRSIAGCGAVLCLLFLLSACETRSISNSGYGPNAFYRGELSEYQVVGVDSAQGFSEADIQKAVIQRQPLTIHRAARLC